jgi:DNA polymerase-1
LRRIFAIDEARMLDTMGWAGMTVEELKSLGLLIPEYQTIRSCFTAAPGCLLVEGDYIQAELDVLAHIAPDKSLIAVMQDPERDMHSEMAIDAFSLACKPYEVKKLHPNIRVLAKSTNYGIAYGRGAAAIVRSALAEGVEATREDGNRLIDTFYARHPGTKAYFDRCHAAVVDPGYVENAFGRRRYFLRTEDEQVRAAQERAAGNMPIQGTVADALSIALYNILRYRDAMGLRFRIVLTVHDAVILEVPYDEVKIVKEVVLPVCMGIGARIPTLGLELGVDVKIMKRWDEQISEEEALELAEREAKQAV